MNLQVVFRELITRMINKFESHGELFGARSILTNPKCKRGTPQPVLKTSTRKKTLNKHRMAEHLPLLLSLVA